MPMAPYHPEELRYLRWIQLWDSSNEHRTGTEGDRATARWLNGEILELGIESSVRQFPFRRLIPTAGSLRVGNTPIHGTPMLDGGSTTDNGTHAQLSLTPDEGCIFLWCSTNREVSLDAVRQATTVSGIVAVSLLSEPGLALINADRYGDPLGPPVLQVASDHEQLLIDAANAGQKATLQVGFVSEATSAINVELRIEGSSSDLDPLVIMTPKSAWYTCTAERIGGIVTWLECIKHLGEHPPVRPVIFTANTGHELGHVGLEVFLDENRGLAQKAFLWVHLGANFASLDSRIRLQGSNQENIDLLRHNLSQQSVKVADVVPPGSRPGGEARNIFDHGGQYVSILGSNRLFHHPSDRYANNVDLPRLRKISDAFKQCVSHWASDV